MRASAQWRREWVRWLHFHRVPLEDVAAILDISPAVVRTDIAARYHRPDGEAWPFNETDRAAVRRRSILNVTANKIRRMVELRYGAPRIAELLELEPPAVRSFIRRIRRRRSVRSDRVKPDELIRPRTEAEETAGRLAAKRADGRRYRRQLKTPPAEWSYQARAETARAEAAALVALQTAVREGRLSAARVLDLAAGLHFAEPRPALPEPAIWTGPESYRCGAPKLDPQQVAEIRELRRAGWSTGKLARRFGVTRSTICNVLLHRTSYRPSPPLPAIVLPSSVEPARVGATKQGLIITAAWQETPKSAC
jgi:lambda repressor-like predicted transcriptional regulator